MGNKDRGSLISVPLAFRVYFRSSQDLYSVLPLLDFGFYCRDFPSHNIPTSCRDPPTLNYPSATDPAEPLRPDLISTRFRPDLELKTPFSGPNRAEIGVEIRPASGPGGGVRLGRCRRGRSGWGCLCSSSGKSLHRKIG